MTEAAGTVSSAEAARNLYFAQLRGLYLYHISSRGSISLSRQRDGLRSISITLATKTLCLYLYIVHVDHCNNKDFVSLSQQQQQQRLYLCHGSRNGFISFTAEAGILFLARQRHGLYIYHSSGKDSTHLCCCRAKNRPCRCRVGDTVPAAAMLEIESLLLPCRYGVLVAVVTEIESLPLP